MLLQRDMRPSNVRHELRRRLGLALLAVTLAGCNTAFNKKLLVVTYVSDPAGAMLYQDERQWGYTPMSLSYDGSWIPFYKGQCLKLRPVAVRWASGAEASIANLSACPDQGYAQQFAFKRPAAVPGLAIDADFAVQVQRNAILQQQNAILQQQADAQEASAVLNAVSRPGAPSAQRNGGLSCISRELHGQILTDCQ